MLKSPSYYKQNELPYYIALQCAPLICGIKISNILIIKNNELDNVNLIFRDTVICIDKIYSNDKKSLLLLYNYKEVESYLHEKYVAQFMNIQGYHTLKIEDTLNELSKRYKNFKDNKDEFPHELGIILGYPVLDVIGFIENKGRNSIYTGYWKVYKNLSQANETFLKYEKAKELVIKNVMDGLSIIDIVNMYQIDHINNIEKLNPTAV